MDMSFSPQELAFRDEVRAWLKAEMPPHIRDKAAVSKGRRFGNYVKAVFSIVFGWGSERRPSTPSPARCRRTPARASRTPSW